MTALVGPFKVKVCPTCARLGQAASFFLGKLIG